MGRKSGMGFHFDLWTRVCGEAVVGEVFLREICVGFSGRLSCFLSLQKSRSTRSLESALPWGGPVAASWGGIPGGSGAAGPGGRRTAAWGSLLKPLPSVGWGPWVEGVIGG